MSKHVQYPGTQYTLQYPTRHLHVPHTYTSMTYTYTYTRAHSNILYTCYSLTTTLHTDLLTAHRCPLFTAR